METPLISNFLAWPYERGKALLTWNLNTPDFVAINVLRDAGNGIFEKIDQVYRRESFKDQTAPTGSLNREISYLLEVSSTGERFGPIVLGHSLTSPLAVEYSDRHRKYLRLKGRPGAFFSIKSFGDRCECYNPITGKKRISNHDKCKGTGRISGYSDAVLSYFAISRKNTKTTLSPDGASQKTFQSLWTGAENYVKPGDVIVLPGNERYRVVEVETSTRYGTPVKHEMSVVQINPNDIEYDLEIPPDILKEIQIVPNRTPPS